MRMLRNKDDAVVVDLPAGPVSEIFDLAPISLWLEDYSGVKALLDFWRENGVTDLRAHLLANTDRIKNCAREIRLLAVNRATLDLYEARDLDELTSRLEDVFRDDMLMSHVEELVQLWNGQHEFVSNAVNYTLSGRRLDTQLKARMLPGYEDDWSRVLIAIDDVSERETARRRLAASEEYARGLFSHSPVSLWVEDFSAVKRLLDDVRMRGIADLRVFTDVHPEFIQRCMSEIRVLDVNRHTLELFGAPDLQTLLLRQRDIFRDGMEQPFREQLIDLWNGKLFQSREVVNYSLAGDELYLHLQFSVLPGHEADWSLVQVALTDITARKKAEAYLEFLGKHDVLTKLYNRSFYVDELARLERKGPWPVSIIIADLNGLKDTNDRLGHAFGDELLRRAGEVLDKLVETPRYAARIGGDEFAILLPGSDETEAKKVIEEFGKLIELNNHFYSSMPLSFSIGFATGQYGARLEEVVKRADELMYEEKRIHHAARDRTAKSA